MGQNNRCLYIYKSIHEERIGETNNKKRGEKCLLNRYIVQALINHITVKNRRTKQFKKNTRIIMMIIPILPPTKSTIMCTNYKNVSKRQTTQLFSTCPIQAIQTYAHQINHLNNVCRFDIKRAHQTSN